MNDYKSREKSTATWLQAQTGQCQQPDDFFFFFFFFPFWLTALCHTILSFNVDIICLLQLPYVDISHSFWKCFFGMYNFYNKFDKSLIKATLGMFTYMYMHIYFLILNGFHCPFGFIRKTKERSTLILPSLSCFLFMYTQTTEPILTQILSMSYLVIC